MMFMEKDAILINLDDLAPLVHFDHGQIGAGIDVRGYVL